MKRFALAALSALSLMSARAHAAPKILYVGDSIAVETSDVVAWWSHNYIGADTSRAMFGGLAICDFTVNQSGGEPQLMQRVREDKPNIVVLQFVGNAFTTCMQNLGGNEQYFAKYYADAEEATRQITVAAQQAGISRPKIMWVLQGPSQDVTHNKRMNDQYREIAAKHGDLVTDAGFEVSAAAFPGADYNATRNQFTFFVPCSDFEKECGFLHGPEQITSRVCTRILDGTHYCLGDGERFQLRYELARAFALRNAHRAGYPEGFAKLNSHVGNSGVAEPVDANLISLATRPPLTRNFQKTDRGFVAHRGEEKLARAPAFRIVELKEGRSIRDKIR